MEHYYSERLRRRLDEMGLARATVVEAPSGYGKTTAVRDFLESRCASKGIPVLWFTATEEAPLSGFRRLCREIARVDTEAGKRLLRLELPNAFTIGEACDALRSIRCAHETYLVVDNYHLLQSALPPAFFLALIEHGGAGLHVIILTQVVSRGMASATAGRDFLRITASDLRLNADDIRRLYRLEGLCISREDALGIERYTEGWIIAIYLQLCAYRENGVLSDAQSIMALMEHLVWDALTDEQQMFLLRLSPFEMLSVQQACSLTSCDALPEYAQAALSGPFIRFGVAEGRYEMHSILSRLLCQKREERGMAFNRDCLTRAGDWCRDSGRISEALGLYWQTRDYERVLSLDLSTLILDEVGNVPFHRIALDIAMDCPALVRVKNPLSMLRIAWALFMAGNHDAFGSLVTELESTLGLDDDPRLRGEWTLLSSFLEFPDIPKMSWTLNKAAPLLRGRPSEVILPTVPWLFASHSALGVFHVTPGEADREADDLEKYIETYSQLTDGHGCGADVLYRAELAYQRGDLAAAEVHAYKAAFLAESRQQGIIRSGAAMILAQIALQKADTAGWQQAVDSMERAASYPMQNTSVVRRALDAVRGVLLVELKSDRLAEWLQEGDFYGCMMPESVMNNAFFVHGMYLMLRGEYPRLIGLMDTWQPNSTYSNPLAKILRLLVQSVGYVNIGDPGRATALVAQAVELAIPDGLISPLMSFSWVLQGIPDQIIRREHPHLLKWYSGLKRRFGRGWSALHGSMFPEDMPKDLTAREIEVAKLAVQGLRNAEIAERLVVSQATVRAHLRTIFQKLDIDRRAKLAERLK